MKKGIMALLIGMLIFNPCVGFAQNGSSTHVKKEKKKAKKEYTLNSEEEALALVEKPYIELFRSLHEDFTVDPKLIKRVRLRLKENEKKEKAPLKLEQENLKKRRDAIRAERKKLNKEISKNAVLIKRLEKKIEKLKEKGKSAEAAKREQEEDALFSATQKARERSESLKKELDGNTNFDFEKAEKRIETLHEVLESGGALDPSEREHLEKEVSFWEKKIFEASGINRKIARIKIKIYLVEAVYSHRFSKLNSLKRWPKKLKKINEKIIAGTQDKRKYGNVEDIGDADKRKVSEGKVIKILPLMVSKSKEIQIGGQEANRILRTVIVHTDERVTEPINRLAQNFVLNSDAWCSFTFYIIADPPNGRELNAFALPGGFVFIHDSLILYMSEGELAAVIAHEISHVNARHFAKASSKMGYIQYATLATVVVGGIGWGTYQAIGFGLKIAALGITRKSESEADLLGTQILWNAGYDPRLLISSFDRLLKDRKAGGSSFFKTHPSLDNRMEKVEEEARQLPPREEYLIGSNEWADVKRAIWEARKVVDRKYKEEEKDRPTLLKKGSGKSSEPSTPNPPVLKRRPKEEKEDPEKQ